MSLKDMEVALLMEYFTPQVGQKRLWHRKDTNLSMPQDGHPYMAPPKDGSPQRIIFLYFRQRPAGDEEDKSFLQNGL